MSSVALARLSDTVSSGYCWLYAITRRDTREVKIGISLNPLLRLYQIQAFHGAPLSLELARVGGREEEVARHKLFKRFHMHGEWFALEPTVENWIKREMSEAAALPGVGAICLSPLRDAERKMATFLKKWNSDESTRVG